MSYQSDVAYVFSIDDFTKVCKDAINEGTKTLYEFQHMLTVFSREIFSKNGKALICIYGLAYSHNVTMTSFMKKELLKYPSDFAYVGDDFDDFVIDAGAYNTLKLHMPQFNDICDYRFIKLNNKEIGG